MKLPKRYVPKSLTKKDKQKQKQQIKKSKRLYKKGKYHTRKNIQSFTSKPSPHITTAKKIYKIDNIKPSKELAKKTKCSLKTLKQIVKKGKGAYYSSGSRPNQTPHSWAYARLASSITGGKSSAVDMYLLREGCKKDSKALILAKKNQEKYKSGRRKTPKRKV